CVAKLSTYLTGVGGAQAGNLTDPVAMQQYNQGQAVVPTGQYCVQITIERTVIIYFFLTFLKIDIRSNSLGP
ncbi:unnamed protein product, partial [Rotaria magnacalcarata]